MNFSGYRREEMALRERSWQILDVARPGDTVIIAGKGHETYQIIGESTVTFDDRLEAKEVLERLTGLK